jgi:hypothetical protein
MATITTTVPAACVRHLKAAATWTLQYEAERTHRAEQELWQAERAEKSVEIAREELSSARSALQATTLAVTAIHALPADQDAEVRADPDVTYFVIHNMASEIVGPRIAAELVFLPLPDEVPTLAEALAWASAESIRLEAYQRGEAMT